MSPTLDKVKLSISTIVGRRSIESHGGKPTCLPILLTVAFCVEAYEHEHLHLAIQLPKIVKMLFNSHTLAKSSSYDCCLEHKLKSLTSPTSKKASQLFLKEDDA